MAVVNTLSATISNVVAKPFVANDVGVINGHIRSFSHEPIEIAAGDDDLSTYRCTMIPSNLRVRQVLLYNDVITGGTSYDIGLYYNSSKLAGVVVPSCIALFASAVDLSTAHGATGPLDVTFEATATNIDSMYKPIWQVAGLLVDPQCMFDVVASSNTNGTGAGTLVIDVRGVVAGV